MAIEAGDIQWNIGADLKGFKAGMAEASKSAKSMGAKFAKHSKAIGAGMTVAGGVITASLGKAVSSFAKTGDQVQKMALKTGVSTEALSELGFAAEQSGTNIETLGKGFKAQADFLEDAKDGLSTATDAMDKLGLSLSDLQGKSPEEVFSILGGAIGDIEDPLQKAALANDVFKRSGVELLPMFASGKAGIQALREEAQRLGVSLSQDQANSAAKFTDTMNSLKHSMSGVAIQIGGALVPVLNSLIERLTPVISRITSWMQANPGLTGSIAMITGAVGGLMITLGPLIIALPGLVTAFGLLKGAALLLTPSVGSLAVAINGLLLPITATLAVLGFTVVTVGMVIDQMSRLRGEQEAARQSEMATSDTLERLIQQYERNGIAIDRTALANKSLDEQIAEVNRQQIAAEMSAGTYGKQIDSTGKSIDDSATKTATHTQATQEGTRAQFGMKHSSAQVKSILERMAKSIKGRTDDYWDLADAATAAANATASVGGGGGKGINVPGRATGGVVNEPFTLVGERGPEIAAFPKGTRIMTNAQTRQAVSEGVSGGTSAGNTSSLSMGDMVINVTAGSGSSPQAISTQIKNDIYRDMAGIWNRIRG